MKLVVDTNVIVAGILRDSSTRKVLLHPIFTFYIPEFAFSEIEQNKDELIEKSGLTRHRFHMVIDRIKQKLIIVPSHKFRGFYPMALELIRKVDETDAPFLALALSFDNDGIWSNDTHFDKQNVIRVWKTKELIDELIQVEEGIYY